MLSLEIIRKAANRIIPTASDAMDILSAMRLIFAKISFTRGVMSSVFSFGRLLAKPEIKDAIGLSMRAASSKLKRSASRDITARKMPNIFPAPSQLPAKRRAASSIMSAKITGRM